MIDDGIIRIGSTPFAGERIVNPNRQNDINRFASTDGVVSVAKPPRLWAPIQQPQQNTGDVNMLNKTAPITAPTRPYMIDSSKYDGGAAGAGDGFAALFGTSNGG